MTATTSTVATALGPVAVTTRSTMPPLLLLHADPGDGRDFAAVVPTLAERYTTYAVDWPGYGGSPAPPEPRATTVMAYAGILPEILGGLGLRRVALTTIWRSFTAEDHDLRTRAASITAPTRSPRPDPPKAVTPPYRR